MKVLVAEDSPVARKILTSSLLRWGCDVTEAENGAAAWELFRKYEFPIVLTDWIMPELDGLGLVRKIRGEVRDRYVYVILLTAKTEKEDLVAAMEAGADDFLEKPFAPDELRVRVRQGERMIRLQRSLAEQNQKLKETQAALVQSEKLASLAQLAAGMAHEINNPIAFVTNNLSVLKRDGADLLTLLDRSAEARPVIREADPELAARLERDEREFGLDDIREEFPRLLDASVEGLRRVRDIVLNLRQFARLDQAELDEIDLNLAVTSTLAVLRRPLEERQLRIERQITPIPSVTCRPGKVNQVLHSLLLNAIQASRQGGMLRINTRPEEAGAGVERQGGVVIEIADEGCGIDKAHLGRIFEPFFTTRPVGQGQGLGLSISYGIIADHGGRIDVESEVGRGSTFRVWLPLRPPSPDSAPAATQ